MGIPGFLFAPTDEELIVHYLGNRVDGKPLSWDGIPTCDVYGPGNDPWRVVPHAYAVGDYFYCFTDRRRRSDNDLRPDRTAGSGTWRSTGRDKKIWVDGRVVGHKMLLSFRGGGVTANNSNWVMHEYWLGGDDGEERSVFQKTVLCRIRDRKKGSSASTTTTGNEPSSGCRKRKIGGPDGVSEEEEIGGECGAAGGCSVVGLLDPEEGGRRTKVPRSHDDNSDGAPPYVDAALTEATSALLQEGLCADGGINDWPRQQEEQSIILVGATPLAQIAPTTSQLNCCGRDSYPQDFPSLPAWDDDNNGIIVDHQQSMGDAEAEDLQRQITIQQPQQQPWAIMDEESFSDTMWGLDGATPLAGISPTTSQLNGCGSWVSSPEDFFSLPAWDDVGIIIDHQQPMCDVVAENNLPWQEQEQEQEQEQQWAAMLENLFSEF